jgi:hypothetical protein
MGYIGSGVQRFNTADGLTVTGSAEINSLTYPTADGSNGQVLKTNGSGTLSFGTVSTDLVNDTSPQLGGDLQSNGNDIVIADTDNIYVGTSNDGLKIHHSNNNSFIEDVGTGNFLITTNGNNIQLMKNQAEQMLVAKTDGSVELYYDNSLKLDTQSHGARVNGGLRFASSGAASDTSNPYIFRTSGADDMVFATGSAERMRLTSAGLLGLGTASPSKLMHLYAGNDSASLRLENTANSKVWEITPANPGVANSGLSIYNVTDDAVALHVDNSNNVGIGTSSPNEKLTIDSGAISFLGSLSTPSIGAGIFRPANNTLAFVTGSSERARILSGGQICVNTTSASGTQLLQLKNANVQWQTGPNSTNGSFDVFTGGNGVYLSSGSTGWSGVSDETVKDIIEPISDAVTKVDSLRAVIGKYKNDDSETRRSFLIAQDVEKVLPEAVDEGSDGKLGLRYTDIIPLLVAAMKEQKSTIEALQTRIAALETA